MSIPIRIRPMFWISAVLIAVLQNPSSIIGIAQWVGIIFFSVLIHEYGHAITSYAFGGAPRIELVAFGGVTLQTKNIQLPKWKELIIIINGPLASFLIAVVAMYCISIPDFASPAVIQVLQLTAFVNLFWTVANLIPVLPLDGGHILRVLCEMMFGSKGLTVTSYASLVFGSIFGIGAFYFGFPFLGMIFMFLVFQNILMLRQLQYVSESDGQEDIQLLFIEIEKIIAESNLQNAEGKIDQILHITKSGVIHDLCLQYKAQLLYERGEKEGVYNLLKPIQDRVSGTMAVVLHAVAFEHKDYALVIQLGSTIFQQYPSPDIAYKIAYAEASMGKEEASLGWFQAAIQNGLEKAKELLEKDPFVQFKASRLYQEIVDSLSGQK